MNDTRLAIAVVSAPALCILLCALGAHCDPDRPVDIGVTVAPCPEAAAATVYVPPTPPPDPPPAYVTTPSDLEAVKMIDAYDPSKLTSAEQDAWWERYHKLLDKAHAERAAAQPPHPHTPP
jgi:hypothetical protein